MELEFYELDFHEIFFLLSLIAPYSIFYKSSFTLKLDFEKIELQKRGISLIRVHLDRTYFAETENWKHYSKIIFKCVNSTVRPIFNRKVAEKWDL